MKKRRGGDSNGQGVTAIECGSRSWRSQWEIFIIGPDD